MPNPKQITMNLTQRAIFERYIAMGSERSISKLIMLLEDEKIPHSKTSLERWSKKFSWDELAGDIESEIVRRMADRMLPLHEERLRKQLVAMDILKESFYRKVAEGKINVELDDFITILKTEMIIRGDPTERITSEHNVNVTHNVVIPDNQLTDILRVVAAQQHGLPPPHKEREHVTIDAEVEEVHADAR
jgi:hypothetical protein